MFDDIDEAIEEIRKGNFVVVVDNEDRENEGDLVIAAEKVTAEKINFMTKYGRGLVCMPVCKERLEDLDIKQMVKRNLGEEEAAFTVSIDHINSGTGISTKARALTIKKVLDKDSSYKDFKRPGHVFPLKARCGGVLEREGHTEAAVDLARLADFYPAGVLCEILNEDGTLARRDDLIEFCKRFNFKIISIEDLIGYRIKKEKPNEKMLAY